MIDARAGSPTIVTSNSNRALARLDGNATVADAILDRLLSRSHRLNLKGKSMWPRKAVASNTKVSDTASLPGDTIA